MRRLLSAVLLFTMAGCAANSQTSRDIAGAGTYKLIAVEGQAVPHKLTSGDEVIDGTLLLKTDGSFAMKTSMRTQMSSTEPLSYQRDLGGTWTSTQLGVQLVWRGGVETSGAYFGRTLRLYHNGIEYLFLK